MSRKVTDNNGRTFDDIAGVRVRRINSMALRLTNNVREFGGCLQCKLGRSSGTRYRSGKVRGDSREISYRRYALPV